MSEPQQALSSYIQAVKKGGGGESFAGPAGGRRVTASAVAGGEHTRLEMVAVVEDGQPRIRARAFQGELENVNQEAREWLEELGAL